MGSLPGMWVGWPVPIRSQQENVMQEIYHAADERTKRPKRDGEATQTEPQLKSTTIPKLLREQGRHCLTRTLGQDHVEPQQILLKRTEEDMRLRH